MDIFVNIDIALHEYEGRWGKPANYIALGDIFYDEMKISARMINLELSDNQYLVKYNNIPIKRVSNDPYHFSVGTKLYRR